MIVHTSMILVVAPINSFYQVVARPHTGLVAQINEIGGDCVCVVCRPSHGVCDLKQVHWMTAHRAWHVYRRADNVELTKRCHALVRAGSGSMVAAAVSAQTSWRDEQG